MKFHTAPFSVMGSSGEPLKNPCRMAIYHLEAKTVSRGAGQSAVGKSAYIAREKLYDERLDRSMDFTRKGGLIFSGVLLPRDAPDWAYNRADLWNRAEAAEVRKDATVAREYIVALPHELTLKQNRCLLLDFVRENFTSQGYAADVNIHAPNSEGDDRNTHVHILVTDRRLGPDGFATHKRERQGTHQQRTTALVAIRESWARQTNRHLKRHGHETRIDSRTLEAQGIARTPSQHLGPQVVAMQRRGLTPKRYADLKGTVENSKSISDLALRAERRDNHSIAKDFEPPPSQAERDRREKVARLAKLMEQQAARRYALRRKYGKSKNAAKLKL